MIKRALDNIASIFSGSNEVKKVMLGSIEVFSSFKPIDVYDGTWSIYSQSVGGGGQVSVSGKTLLVSGYSSATADNYSSGGYKGDTIIARAMGKTLAYSFDFVNQSAYAQNPIASIILRNLDSNTDTVLHSINLGTNRAQTISNSLVLDSNDRYEVRVYIKDAGGWGGSGQKTVTATCRACLVS